MELQQAEGTIALTFICVKCFVNFFVSCFSSIFLLAYCFFVFFHRHRPSRCCILSESHRGITDFLRANWVWIGLCELGGLAVWLWKPGHMAAVCCEVAHRECRGLGSWPLPSPGCTPVCDFLNLNTLLCGMFEGCGSSGFYVRWRMHG